MMTKDNSNNIAHLDLMIKNIQKAVANFIIQKGADGLQLVYKTLPHEIQNILSEMDKKND